MIAASSSAITRATCVRKSSVFTRFWTAPPGEWLVMEAIILAGGLGARLRDAVPDLPKAMAPINGRPFLEHQLDYWIQQGVGRFVLSVGYRHEAITAHFGAAYRGIPLEY